MKFGFEYSPAIHDFDYMIHVMIKHSEYEHDPIYMFDISPEGFHHMFGVIEEYPDIEYVNKLSEYDNDDYQDGRLKIIGEDLLGLI